MVINNLRNKKKQRIFKGFGNEHGIFKLRPPLFFQNSKQEKDDLFLVGFLIIKKVKKYPFVTYCEQINFPKSQPKYFDGWNKKKTLLKIKKIPQLIENKIIINLVYNVNLKTFSKFCMGKYFLKSFSKSIFFSIVSKWINFLCKIKIGFILDPIKLQTTLNSIGTFNTEDSFLI